jgi:flagellar biosynthesis protein FliR
MVSMVAMGFLMKTMPQLNVLSVGFAVYIVGGLLMLVFALFSINETIAGFMAETLEHTAYWVRSLGEPMLTKEGG